MSLKLKLLLGFLAVLLLTLMVGFWGVHGMKTIENTNIRINTITEAVSHLQSAQSEQMKYFLYGGDEYINVAKKFLEESKEHFREEIALLPAGSSHQNNVSSLLRDVDTMSTAFDAVLTLASKLAKVDSDYTDQGIKLVSSINELIASAYQNQAEEQSVASAEEVKLVMDTRAQLYEVRLKTWPLSVNPSQKNLDAVLTGLNGLTQALKLVEEKTSRNSNRILLQRILKEVDIYRNFVSNSGKMTAQRQQMVLDLGKLTDVTVKKAEALTHQMTDESAAAQKNITIQLLVVVGIAVLLSLSLSLLITRNVLCQLGRDPGVLEDMAHRVSIGDYDIDDGRPSQGVYKNFVGMVEALRENMTTARKEAEHARKATEAAQEAARQAEEAKREAQNARREGMLNAALKLEDVVAIVSSASEELSAQIAHSERGADYQASRITETATAMEEMNSTVVEVARNAGNAAEVSTATRQKAEAGATVVRQAVNSIQQVQSQSIQLKDDMDRLDENAKAIDQIMSVISDIADQTNLLALNAAIEAARAGDAGRGFAVVADEVRKLAEKTMASTGNVAEAIRNIQQSAAKSREQVDGAVRSIEEATTFARQSGESLKEIVALTDRTADQVRAIATASEQQSASSEEINHSIAEVSNIAGETSQAMAEATRAVTELTTQAQVLSRLIDDMKQS